MSSLNRSLITILGLGWIGFLGIGFGVRTFATPSVVVLIDRSYCPPDRWQSVANTYQDLYQQDQQKQIQIQQVILFSSLGQESITPIPTPADLRDQQTYGRPASERETELKSQYPNAQILNCRT